jgi:hypothetical protein
MPLNTSGPISLGGATAGQSIAVELGLSSTGSISLNQSDVRTLAGVPTGAITMPTNFYGKSYGQLFSMTIGGQTSSPWTFRGFRRSGGLGPYGSISPTTSTTTGTIFIITYQYTTDPSFQSLLQFDTSSVPPSGLPPSFTITDTGTGQSWLLAQTAPGNLQWRYVFGMGSGGDQNRPQWTTLGDVRSLRIIANY